MEKTVKTVKQEMISMENEKKLDLINMEKSAKTAKREIVSVENEKKLDFTNLEDRLNELNSRVFMNAERACRMSGDPTPDIIYSSAFRARLVAAAMGVTYDEIKNINIKEYSNVVTRVLNFLLASLGEMVIQHNN